VVCESHVRNPSFVGKYGLEIRVDWRCLLMMVDYHCAKGVGDVSECVLVK